MKTITKPVNVEVNAIFDAIEKFIKQRPELDKANYGLAPGQIPRDDPKQNRKMWWEAYRSYQSELRSIGKDLRRARVALGEAQALEPQKPELLLAAFQRAFSGRLSIGLADRVQEGQQVLDSSLLELQYTAGQYYPTEYRKAAASVLEAYIADWKQEYAKENPQEFVYFSMEDVKAANQRIGNHFFDRGTMRFFNSKIESGLIGGKYFVTSERRELDMPKLYTVRVAEPDGRIDKIGEFQQYGSKGDATQAIRDLMKGGAL